ncbi:acetate--CoA ligase family protein [Massilia sp. H-1]|nr:acetate--CoA ligase family protein [Massilia sp. H-1]
MADHDKAAHIVRAVLAEGRAILTEPEAKDVMAAYGIAVVATRTAAGTGEAVAAADAIGYPVALKVLSPDITHKSDVGGVALDLDSAAAVRSAAQRMHKRLHELAPQARLQGFSVQQMARRPEAHELIIGVATDPVFGPVILFGQGGVAVEVTADHAVALPPLNDVLARDMISRTRVARLLVSYRNRKSADLDAIVWILMRISQMVADLPELVELDINPLLADSSDKRSCSTPGSGWRAPTNRPVRSTGWRSVPIRASWNSRSNGMARRCFCARSAPKTAAPTRPSSMPSMTTTCACACSCACANCSLRSWRALPRSTTTAKWPLLQPVPGPTASPRRSAWRAWWPTRTISRPNSPSPCAPTSRGTAWARS